MASAPTNPAFANAETAAIPASPASVGDSSAMTGSALDRLSGDAAAQVQRNSTQLALTPYEYGLDPGGINPQTSVPSGPTPQDQHPSAQRLNSSAWAGKTGMLNHAQAAEDNAPVWVTVPVDKVTTKGPISESSASANAVYATPKGYQPRPGNSPGSIPPVPQTGRPLHGDSGFGTAWS